MSFREKSAWISLISIFLASAFFLLHFTWSLAPPPNPPLLHGLIQSVILLIVLEVVAHIVIAISSPRDAQAPKDERDRLIDLKSTRVSHVVYTVGTLAAVATIHLGANAIGIGYLVLLAFVVAEMVRFGSRIVYHRWGV